MVADAVGGAEDLPVGAVMRFPSFLVMTWVSPGGRSGGQNVTG